MRHLRGLAGKEEGGAGAGDPHHLPDGGLAVGEEIAATRAKDRVKAPLPKGEALGAPLAEREGETVLSLLQKALVQPLCRPFNTVVVGLRGEAADVGPNAHRDLQHPVAGADVQVLQKIVSGLPSAAAEGAVEGSPPFIKAAAGDIRTGLSLAKVEDPPAVGRVKLAGVGVFKAAAGPVKGEGLPRLGVLPDGKVNPVLKRFLSRPI